MTNLEQDKIFDDYKKEIESIKNFIKILTNSDELHKVMKTELEDIKNEYGENRRTVVSSDEGELKKEDLIKRERVIVVLTKEDYVKRLPANDFKKQKRGGRGINATKFKEGDEAKLLCEAHTHDTILCFSTLGKVYSIRVFDIPDPSRQARGRQLIIYSLSKGVNKLFVVINSFDDGFYLCQRD